MAWWARRSACRAALSCVAAVCGGARPAAAQGASAAPRVQPELRVDALLARASALHVGVGARMRAGPLLRVSAVAAAGLARAGDAAGGREAVGSLRGELVARYLFDPNGEHRRGVYAGGGLGVRRDGSGPWSELLVVVAGVEGQARRGLVTAAEVGVGGGVRIGVVFRRGRDRGR
jgi:hypothetical protein